MFIEIGSYEAKTKLPELLREVQAGQCFTITLRGKPVASLVPCTSAADYQAAVNEMKSFPRIEGVSAEQVSKWITEGRA